MTKQVQSELRKALATGRSEDGTFKREGAHSPNTSPSPPRHLPLAKTVLLGRLLR
jgi:hypothetical protein